MSATWFRVPTWVGGRFRQDRAATEEEAWVELLGRWHQGEDVSAYALAEALGWGKGRTLRLMPRVAEWAIEAGATVPARWVADRTSAPKRTAHRTVATEKEPMESASSGPKTDRTPDRKRTVSRARVPLVEKEETERERETSSHPASAACAAPPPPVAIEQPPLVPPTPEPDPAPVPPAKPARASKPKPPRAERSPTPGYREAIDRWDRAYREAHGDATYPYVFSGRDSDAGHVRTVLAAARYTEADAAGALDRIENAARAYMASAALGQTYPRGEPVTLRWFARDIARWLRVNPGESAPAGEILKPDFRSGRRMSPQEEHVATLEWIAAARAKLAARSTPDADA